MACNDEQQDTRIRRSLDYSKLIKILSLRIIFLGFVTILDCIPFKLYQLN